MNNKWQNSLRQWCRKKSFLNWDCVSILWYYCIGTNFSMSHTTQKSTFYFFLGKLKVYILFPCRLLLLQYRKPSSSTPTCRWPRQLLSGKQNHPLRIDMVHQRYRVPSWLQMIISGQDLAFQPSFEVGGFKVDSLFFLTRSPDFLRWECPPLDQKCQCPST